jgi:hypothetical protein
LDEKYADGGIFSKYILYKNLPEYITYNLIDVASIYRSVKANEKHRQIPISDVYQIVQVKPNFVSVGYFKLIPVEQLFL